MDANLKTILPTTNVFTADYNFERRMRQHMESVAASSHERTWTSLASHLSSDLSAVSPMQIYRNPIHKVSGSLVLLIQRPGKQQNSTAFPRTGTPSVSHCTTQITVNKGNYYYHHIQTCYD